MNKITPTLNVRKWRIDEYHTSLFYKVIPYLDLQLCTDENNILWTISLVFFAEGEGVEKEVNM